MYTDPIADMLNRIRSAQGVKKKMVDIPFSEIKYGIAQCMEKEGFINKIIKKKKQSFRFLRIILEYENEDPVIREIKRISSPGQRIYKKHKELKSVKSGTGISILSTPKGIITNKEAKKRGVGGEVICEIW